MEGRRSRAERRRGVGAAGTHEQPIRDLHLLGRRALVVPVPGRLRSTAPCSSPISYQNLADGDTYVRRRSDRRRRQRGRVGFSMAGRSTGRLRRRRSARGLRRRRPRPPRHSGSQPTKPPPRSSASWTPAASFGCASPKRYARLRRSLHTFSVRAIDAAGNRDATPASHRWTVGLAKAAFLRSISPAPGARIASPPLLRWRPVARASYYNVQVFRGGVKVLSMWPTRTRFQLRARWTFLGRQYRLSAGKYNWYVWPRFGRGAAGRYGNALGRSTFTVAASRRR